MTAKKIAWKAANTIVSDWNSRATGLEAETYTAKDWHGSTFIADAAWPVVIIGDLLVVDIMQKDQRVLIQVTTPTGECLEATCPPVASTIVDLALELVDEGLEDKYATQ